MSEQTIRIALSEPLKSRKLFGHNIIEFVNIRKPRVKDILGLDHSMGADSMVKLASRLTGVAEDDLHAMSIPDYLKISEAISSLMNGDKK